MALFNLAIDSKLRACDLVAVKVSDVTSFGEVKDRTIIVQRKTGRPVQFEITPNTATSLERWIEISSLMPTDYLFPSRAKSRPHLSTRQYARLVDGWVTHAGSNAKKYGTHSLRRTKAAQIYKKTGNLRAVQILLGHTKIESTVRYLGVDVEDALEISSGLEL